MPWLDLPRPRLALKLGPPFPNGSRSGSMGRKVMDKVPDSTPPGAQDGDNPAVRRHVRKPVAAKVTGKAEAGLGHLFFDSQDLSIGGAFLKADLLLEVGDELSLELHLPGW